MHVIVEEALDSYRYSSAIYLVRLHLKCRSMWLAEVNGKSKQRGQAAFCKKPTDLSSGFMQAGNCPGAAQQHSRGPGIKCGEDSAMVQAGHVSSQIA